MTIRYQTTKSPKRIKEICLLGRYYGLFIPGFKMHDIYQQPETVFCAAIAYSNGVPVGICLKGKDLDENYDISVYVSVNFRRQGIGTQLVKRLNRLYKAQYPEMRRPESRGFFSSLGY